MRLILVDIYEVTEPDLYRHPKTPKLIDLGGDAVREQPPLSPKGSSISLSPLTSVTSIESTLANCPAPNSPTLIEQKGNDYTGGTDSLYVALPFDWCYIYLFETWGDSEAQPRRSILAIVQPPTPPPSLTSLPTPHAAIAKLGLPVPTFVVGVKRKFVDDSNPLDCSINPLRRARDFPCVLHLIVLHINH